MQRLPSPVLRQREVPEDEEAEDDRRRGISALLRRVLPPEGGEEPAGNPGDGRRPEYNLEVDLEVRAPGRWASDQLHAPPLGHLACRRNHAAVPSFEAAEQVAEGPPCQATWQGLVAVGCDRSRDAVRGGYAHLENADVQGRPGFSDGLLGSGPEAAADHYRWSANLRSRNPKGLLLPIPFEESRAYIFGERFPWQPADRAVARDSRRSDLSDEGAEITAFTDSEGHRDRLQFPEASH